MRDEDIDAIAGWIANRGLAGDGEIPLLHGFCERCDDAGLPITRAIAIIDTLHPVYEGRVFYWAKDKELQSLVTEYEPSVGGAGAEAWLNSPFFRLLHSGNSEMRQRLEQGETGGYAELDELRQDGQTDWLAIINRFDRMSAIGEMDCFISRWTTTRLGGFADADIQALRRLVPLLGLAIKSTSLVRVAESLVEAYLGRDAGRRVLQGRMSRGAVEKINAVVWFSDIEGYTALSESIATDELIPLLNDYAEAVIASVHSAGGDVLKLIGDGVLAIFTAGDSAQACSSALLAERDLRRRLEILNRRRAAEGSPVADIYLALHIGDVFYGNIGSKERLDFTVVGKAVNEASRIASMCRPLDRGALFSSAFHACLPDADKAKLVSVGRYALRGVSRPQELFTIDPDMAGPVQNQA